jgi:ABC-type Fe3+-hydroxamate transport system substrate-binding protein
LRALLGGLLLALALAGCKGIASSAGGAAPAAAGQASGGQVGDGTAPRVVIDRECSKLEDGADEYVCIKNEGQRPVEMGSWVLRNVLGRSYNFPPGFQLPAGATVKLHTGAGADSAGDLYWDYRVKPAWEKGDKLTLHNSENAEVFVSEPRR